MVRKQLLGYSLIGLFVALVGHGVATAQAPGAEPDPAGARQVALSPQDQLTQSKGFLTNMERVREGVRRDLEEARNQRDVVKSLCLDDKLNQLDVAINKVSDRMKGLEVAAERSDGELSGHEFTIISVLHQRSQQLDAEAKLCIGKEVVAVGESDTKLEIDGTLPGEEATTTFPQPPIIIEPPTCSSCFR